MSRRDDAVLAVSVCGDGNINAPLVGDRNLAAQLVDVIEGCSSIVETGTYLGFTTCWFNLVFPNIKYFGVEVDKDRYRKTKTRVPEVEVYLGDSESWLRVNINQLGNRPFFFLDAHWFDPWPLSGELKIIAEQVSSPVVLVHDFNDQNGSRFDPGNDIMGPVGEFRKARNDLVLYVSSFPLRVGVALFREAVDSEDWKLF